MSGIFKGVDQVKAGQVEKGGGDRAEEVLTGENLTCTGAPGGKP